MSFAVALVRYLSDGIKSPDRTLSQTSLSWSSLMLSVIIVLLALTILVATDTGPRDDRR
jgi:hypothetical protein